SQRPACTHRQSPQVSPPADVVQRPGLRRLHHGLPCRYHRRTSDAQGRGLNLRRSRRLSLEELAPYLLEGRGGGGGGRADKTPVAFSPLAPRLSPLNWRAVFGNDHPVEVEVGFGKGLFLIQAAQACPQVNFLGIEITRKYQLFTATRLAKRALGNVRLV